MEVEYCWLSYIEVGPSYIFCNSRGSSEPVLGFWWKLLLHLLHLTGMVLNGKVAEYLPRFFFRFLTLVIDKPWHNKEVREDRGSGKFCYCWSCWCWLDWALVDTELLRWHFQFCVGNSQYLSSPRGMGKPLQVVVR